MENFSEQLLAHSPERHRHHESKASSTTVSSSARIVGIPSAFRPRPHHRLHRLVGDSCRGRLNGDSDALRHRTRAVAVPANPLALVGRGLYIDLSVYLDAEGDTGCSERDADRSGTIADWFPCLVRPRAQHCRRLGSRVVCNDDISHRLWVVSQLRPHGHGQIATCATCGRQMLIWPAASALLVAGVTDLS